MLHDISFPVWRRLFSLGLDFKELKPWEWMDESMMFGVVQPESGEIGYCVVLGKNHPVQGIAVFKGNKGLHQYLHQWKKDQTVVPADCLLLSFADLDKFWKEEKELFEWLEMEVEGQYPLIRDYETGMESWPLEQEETARLMMFAIEQSISMAIRFKKERILSSPSDPENLRILMRTPFRKGAMLLWKDQWKEIKDEYEEGSAAIANKLYLRSNCESLPVQANKKWIVEVFPFPEMKRPPDQRPYYPYALVVGNQEDESFIGEFMFKPAELREQLQIRVKDLLVFEGYKPVQFEIVGEESVQFLSEITKELGIKSVLVEESPLFFETMKAKVLEG